MKRLLILLLGILLTACSDPKQEFFPAKRAKQVNPDTRLAINFLSEPTIGTSGMIRVWDAATNKVVDSLDLSIPAGPTTPTKLPKPPYGWKPYDYNQPRRTNADTKPGTPSGVAGPTTTVYQLTIIGGFTDGFHFHPIIVTGTKAEIYLHHNLLEYGKRYYVTIDDGVLTTADDDFHGITKEDGWYFTTKKSAPAAESRRLTVNADGSADFTTVQGALDFVPDFSGEEWTIFVHNGDYEELVYFRNKTNLTIEGESREGVHIHYPNNEVFNPHPDDVATNEYKGTFPSRRAAFMADNCTDLKMLNLTISTTLRGQAEGLLLMGERIHLENVFINGSGDALQANGSCYFYKCRIKGDGDSVLGRGPCFFEQCKLISRGPFMWIRNDSEKSRGNIFYRCRFKGVGRGAVFARTNDKYAACEAVLLNCQIENVEPAGWGRMPADCSRLHYWEFNSTDTDDRPIDISQRAAGSRQLDAVQDSLLIASYSNPAWVLGWNPKQE